MCPPLHIGPARCGFSGLSGNAAICLPRLAGVSRVVVARTAGTIDTPGTARSAATIQVKVRWHHADFSL